MYPILNTLLTFHKKVTHKLPFRLKTKQFKMRVFIVEDNAGHLNVLKAKVESLGYCVAGTCPNATRALSGIKAAEPDVILLDINLNTDNEGIDLAREIKEIFQVPVVFITSQSADEVIRDAVSAEPAGYLLKPVDPAELKANIELAVRNKSHHSPDLSEVNMEDEYLTVRIGERLQLLRFEDIKVLMVETKNYVTLVNNEGKHFVIRDSLKSLINSVLPNYFIRTHHSYAVNVNYISFIDEKEQTLYLKAKESIPIGKSFKKLVYQKMNIKS